MAIVPRWNLPKHACMTHRNHVFMHGFHSMPQLGFCSVRECPIFAHRVQLYKFLDCECVSSVPTWNLPQNTCTTHRKPILMHDFHSMPWVGIQEVSLKACRSWNSKCDKMIFVARIKESSTPLDSGHWDSARRVPLLWVHVQGIIFSVNFGN